MTNNTPKSIDTFYNGYKFRSRLEARWAIFFDELHISYDYEPIGFDLIGIRYLPDFQITSDIILHQLGISQSGQLWIEVKPNSELSESDRKKIAEFVKKTDHHVLLISGSPDINTSLRFIDHHPETSWLVTDVRWIELPDSQIGLVPIEKLNNKELLAQTNTPRLRYALDKARQSRFEFGQTPIPPTAANDQGSISSSNDAEQDNGSQIEEPAAETPQITTAKSNTSLTRTKICRSCGKDFEPLLPHFNYCHSCYLQENKGSWKSTAYQTGDTSSARSSKQIGYSRRKWYFIPLPILFGCILPILVFGGLVLMSGWFMNYMGAVGLFGTSNSAASTSTVTIPATYTPQTSNVTAPGGTPISPFTNAASGTADICSCAKNTYDCADFATHTEAQACFDSCFDGAGDIHFLDSNEDGQACETLP